MFSYNRQTFYFLPVAFHATGRQMLISVIRSNCHKIIPCRDYFHGLFTDVVTVRYGFNVLEKTILLSSFVFLSGFSSFDYT